MTALVGHDHAWREWRAAIQSGRMHHAWILTGIKGLGKGTFARTAATELVEGAGLNHPDIHVLDHLPANETEEEKRSEGKPFQTKRNITVDQIRRMQARLTTRPTMGERRVIIIDPADDMEKNAVNALLKSLEEPPIGTFFLLVSHALGRLLPTIRSRCRILRFAPLGDDGIDKILAQEAPQADTETRHAAIAAARGSPGSALGFVEQRLGTAHALMRRIAEEGDDSFALRGQMAEEIGARPDRERQLAILELARAVITAQLGQTSARDPRIIEAHAELVRLSGQITSYNFDSGLVAMEIGALLASLVIPREAA